jgi:hypothetical protein
MPGRGDEPPAGFVQVVLPRLDLVRDPVPLVPKVVAAVAIAGGRYDRQADDKGRHGARNGR